MGKMKAIVQEKFGNPEVLDLREVDRPVLDDEERVLVRVRAASLNMYDWHMTTGTPYLARAVVGWRSPKHPIPGADLAGVVEVVGSKVTRFEPGDEVFGDAGFGAFAEYARPRAGNLVGKPAGVTFEQAAATPMAGLTALQGLRDHGRLEAGQRVLVNGASGGVGTFAVQIAKVLGAEVTAVCSTSKVEMARSIGADHVIDYTVDDFVETERGYHLLFDNVGFRPWSETRRVLTPDGINVTITGPKHAVMGPYRRMVFRKVISMLGDQHMTWFTAETKQKDLELLAGLLASGEVAPVIENTYPLEKMPDALRHLGEGHAMGKLVITM